MDHKDVTDYMLYVIESRSCANIVLLMSTHSFSLKISIKREVK